MTGISLLFCAASSTRAACASVDSAADVHDVRTLSLKKLCRAGRPASVAKQTLRDTQESGERLITPMMAGCELKANGLPPMENSFTRADAAARFSPAIRPVVRVSTCCETTRKKLKKEGNCLENSAMHSVSAMEWRTPAATRTRDPLLRRGMLYHCINIHIVLDFIGIRRISSLV